MIASPDLLHATRREPSPEPVAVREEAARPGPAANADDAASCAIPGPSDPGAVQDGDDELVRLGERIAELAERINSAEARMMTLIAEFDRRGGWKGEYSSCAEWLAWRIGIKIGPARERVRTARALAGLPQTAEALREGRISYTKVRALTRVATPASEGELLAFAQAGSAARLEGMVRMWKKRNARGTNPGRKSCKVLQDCTICVSCRLTGLCWTGPQKRENRNRLAGILHTLPPLLRGPGSRISSPSLRCDALWVCVAGRPGVA